MAKKRILLIDNYKTTNSKQIKEVENAIRNAGKGKKYDVSVMRHSELKKELASGNDVLKDFDGYVSSGSGKTWKRKGTTSSDGKEYLENKDPVHEHLAEHEKPGYHICAGMDALANALGYQIEDTGKFNRGIGEDGHNYNHKYGLAKENIDAKLSEVNTFKHNGKEYVSSFKYGNKHAVKYHAERTEKGKKEIEDFLKQYIN